MPPVKAAAAGASSAITGEASGPAQEGSVVQRPGRRTGYEHLVPLFADRAALTVGHPRRERLRGS